MQQLMTRYVARTPEKSGKRKRAPEGEGHLGCVLPVELVPHILRHVDEDELVYWRHVSRFFREEVDRVCWVRATNRTNRSARHAEGHKLRITITAVMRSPARFREAFSAAPPWGGRIGFCALERRMLDYAAFTCDYDAIAFLAERGGHDGNLALTAHAAEQDDMNLLKWLKKEGRVAITHERKRVVPKRYDYRMYCWFWKHLMPLTRWRRKRVSDSKTYEGTQIPVTFHAGNRFAKHYELGSEKDAARRFFDAQTHDILRMAIQRGSLEVVQEIVRDLKKEIPFWAINWAARSGSVAMLKYVLDNVDAWGHKTSVQQVATKYGRVAILDWWWGPDEKWADYVCDKFHYWIHSERPFMFSGRRAIEHDQLAVLQWFTRRFGKSTFDDEWVRGSSWAENWMVTAAVFGRVHILDWCRGQFEHKFSVPFVRIANLAAMHNKPAVLDWVVRNAPAREQLALFPPTLAVEAAARSHLNVLYWMHTHGVPFSEEVSQAAHERLAETTCTDAQDVLDWLASIHAPGSRPERACKRRRLNQSCSK